MRTHIGALGQGTHAPVALWVTPPPKGNANHNVIFCAPTTVLNTMAPSKRCHQEVCLAVVQVSPLGCPTVPPSLLPLDE
jgi:hypothetical protein